MKYVLDSRSLPHRPQPLKNSVTICRSFSKLSRRLHSFALWRALLLEQIRLRVLTIHHWVLRLNHGAPPS